jgi:hypothetical protein
MADKTMLNFRCPAELLEAIDAIGRERYPSDTAKHGCDRTKTLLDIVRAGIEALSSEETVLQPSDSGMQTVLQPSDSGMQTVLQVFEAKVRQGKTTDVIDIEARFVAIEERLGKLRA